MPRSRWPGAFAATALLATVLVSTTDATVTGPGAGAQAAEPFTITVSKTADLVSGETIEVNVRTTGDTIVFPGDPSEVRTCRWQESYTAAQFDNIGAPGTCVINHAPVSSSENSLDDDVLYRFPDNGSEHGRRAFTTLRPGVGVANWLQAGVQQELPCGPENRCRLVFRLRLQTGTAAPVTRIVPFDELTYRPAEGVAGCSGPAVGAIESTMPDRLQDAWLDWTRSICQRTTGQTAPTNAFFQNEGDSLNSLASGSYDLAYSAVGYRPGFQPARERSMVPVPVGLNAVVVAVGGGYLVEDGSWPVGLARPPTDFKLTNQELAILLGQFQGAMTIFHGGDIVARNPQVLTSFYLSNSAVGAPLALTGAQSTSLFASTYFDTMAPADWTDREGAPRGVETDFNLAEPTHSNGAMDLKTGRPDLARIVYKNLFELGTYYVLTDLATADALGLTPVSLQNAAGDWVTPNASTLTAAVPSLVEQDDGTLAPDPQATTGYPLTYVEYAMAPAQTLVTESCQRRTASQDLLADWLEYITTDGQSQLGGGGLVPLTADLAAQAEAQRAKVGATPAACVVTPPTTTTTTTTTTVPPASVTNPGSFDGGSAPDDDGVFDNGDDTDNLTGNRSARPSRAATPDTQRDSVRAAREAKIELPDLLGVRSINTLMPPLALLVIVALSTLAALATAGYPTPAFLRRLPGQTRTAAAGVASATRRLLRRGAPAPS